MKPRDNSITWFGMLRMKKMSLKDFFLMSAVCAIGLIAAWMSQMAGYTMSPTGAARTSAMLDDMELPRELPNEMVESEDGRQVRFWSLISRDRNIVAVYAPWCAPCQKELPRLHQALTGNGNLVVLIDMKEDGNKVKEQLTNLGLGKLHYYRDITGLIFEKGKIRSLPTTFLTKSYGKVIDRVVGFSEYRIERMVRRANPDINE